MDLGLENKVALVLGAGGGLGGAIARTLASEGAHVAACDISEESLSALCEKAEANGDVMKPYSFDLENLTDIEAAVSSVEEQLGVVQILVNMTGGPPPLSATDVSTDEWEKQFRAMVSPVLHLTRRVLPGMRSAGWGRVITSTSSGVVSPIPNLAISNALRSSLVGWSKTLANEVSADGVTVNVIVPGRIATARIRQLDEARAQREGRSADDVSHDSAASIPAKRYGTPQEFADVAAFLCSDRASYVNGSMVRVDGGLIPSI